MGIISSYLTSIDDLEYSLLSLLIGRIFPQIVAFGREIVVALVPEFEDGLSGSICRSPNRVGIDIVIVIIFSEHPYLRAVHGVAVAVLHIGCKIAYGRVLFGHRPDEPVTPP